MKTIIRYFTLGLLCVAGTSCLIGQEAEKPIYFKLDYMKVAPGKAEEYVNLERNHWKALHAERIKAGDIVSWTLFRVRFPAGSHRDYEYITSTGYDDFGKINTAGWGRRAMEALGKSEAETELLLNQTVQSRNIYKSEIWLQNDGINPTGDVAFIQVNFMEVPSGAYGAFLDFRRDFIKPVQQAKIDAGKQLGWGVYSLWFPSGSKIGYSHATVDMFANFADVANRTTPEIREAAHPGHDQEWWQGMYKKMVDSRETTSWELWEAVDTVNAETIAAGE